MPGRESPREASAGVPAGPGDAGSRIAARLLSSTPTLVALWDPDLRCLYSNAAHERFFGYDDGGLLGVHLGEMLGPVALEFESVRLRDVLDGVPQRFTASIANAAGEARELEMLYLPDETSGGFFAAGTDVTAREAALRTLRQAELIAGLGSWTADGDGDPWFSPSMYRLVGRDPATWTPNWADQTEHIHPEDRERVTETATTARDRGAGYELEYRLRRPDGETRTIRARCDIEVTAEGTVHRHGTELDITDLRRAEEDARLAHTRVARLAQTQADLIALIGHDAKQPLTVIRGHLGHLEEDWDDLPEDMRRRGLTRAIAAARRLDGLIDEVLAMARLESLGDEEVPTSPRQVLVADVVAQVVEEMTDPDGVTVSVTGRPTAYVDPWQLRQVLANLTANAVKYGVTPITVTARTLDPDPEGRQWVEIRVLDSGEGVPASFLPRLFGRFERAEEGVASTKRGNGFGLYIVRRLLAANGGRVRYETAPGGGACFVVELPTD
ncbi:PAS domain-containing protein [Nocardioidaceae bacterium]|nr:PAS domain-containing protein [Nocardioidaceae bacterium]